MNELNKIYDDICNITDATTFYSSEEIEEQRNDFISSMQNENKEYRKQYTDFLQEQIESMRPVGTHGQYDFELEREIENIIERINKY